MGALTRQVKAMFKVACGNNQLVARDALLGNMRRIRWLVLAVIPLNLLFVAIFWWFADPVDTRQLAWTKASGWTHLAMALWMGLCGVVAHRAVVRAAGSLHGQVLQVIEPLGALLFTVAMTTIDQWVTPSISPYLLGSAFVSLAVLMRPVVAVTTHLLAFAAFYVCLALTQHDLVHLLSNRLNGFSAMVLGIVLGSVAALYAAADHALYEAKKLGRNRVEKTEPDGSLTPSDFQRMRRN